MKPRPNLRSGLVRLTLNDRSDPELKYIRNTGSIVLPPRSMYNSQRCLHRDLNTPDRVP